MKLEYYINLDERGDFNSDVRRNGETVFEIKDSDHLCEMIEDGFLKHGRDINGLTEYLKSVELLRENETISYGN